jgi:hypothetical protein
MFATWKNAELLRDQVAARRETQKTLIVRVSLVGSKKKSCYSNLDDRIDYAFLS